MTKKQLMEGTDGPPTSLKKVGITPKALIHQKFGSNASYRIEEIQHFVDHDCPGLNIQRQSPCLYRCYLDLPEFSFASDAFTKKKDAEQAAAKIAVEKLGIQSARIDFTPQEAKDELIARISVFLTDEFLSSLHPLVGHFCKAMRKGFDRSIMIPAAAIAACDAKTNNLCRIINPKSELDPLLCTSLIIKAAKMSGSLATTGKSLWISRQPPYRSEILQSLIERSFSIEVSQIDAVLIPFSLEENVRLLTFGVSDKYFMDEIAKVLELKDSSQIIVSRTVGKASSEMRLYFGAQNVSTSIIDSENPFSDLEDIINLDSVLNLRAFYLSGQKIFGNALLANVGYTWRSTDLFYEDVSLCTYYKMLLSKLPDGHYKLSRDAILAAELPSVFTSRSNWRGPYPKDLLYVFCRQHRLSEPVFSVECGKSSEQTIQAMYPESKFKSSMPNGNCEAENLAPDIPSDGKANKVGTFRCKVRLVSKKGEPIIECCPKCNFKKEFDAIQNAALIVLNCLNKCFKLFDVPMEELVSLGHDITVYPANFSCEIVYCFPIYRVINNFPRNRRFLDSVTNKSDKQKENGMILLSTEGSDSAVFPSPGSLACISYAVTFGMRDDPLKRTLERKDEFEFEVGTDSVIDQLEACVTQLSVKQSARFTIDLPSIDLILAVAGESANQLLQTDLDHCVLEYFIKVLNVTQPPEDRMEQAMFSPPLSKQRVGFAVQQINVSNATTLVDFGCGSGSLLESLLEHSTTLEQLVGVDISQKSLTRAAKVLHSKLSMDSIKQRNLISAVIYDGSITEFDSRLYGFDIGTCLEVIEHMEEEQAELFGNVALGQFRPNILIVSTPNYEYNPILQRFSSSNKDDIDENLEPCKFRNLDHKFEWTRQQFEHWATDLASRHDYSVHFSGVGGSGDLEPGFASQIAVFRCRDSYQTAPCLKVEEDSHTLKEIWKWSKET